MCDRVGVLVPWASWSPRGLRGRCVERPTALRVEVDDVDARARG